MNTRNSFSLRAPGTKKQLTNYDYAGVSISGPGTFSVNRWRQVKQSFEKEPSFFDKIINFLNRIL